MSESLDLRQIQQRTFQLMSFEDGLWDLLLGTTFIFLSTYPVTREILGPVWNLVLFLSLLTLIEVGYLLLRRSISQPRIGYATARRSRKVWLLVAVTAVLVLLTFGLVLLTLLSPGTEPTNQPVPDATSRSYLVELIVLLVMGGLFSIMGYFFGVTRMYFYGWMLGVTNLASIYMEHNAGWVFQVPLATAALIIMVIGVVRLARFLQKYPAREEG